MTIKRGDALFKTAQLYYVIVENQSEEDEAQFTLTLSQQRTIINLANGVPLKVTFQGSNDVSKNFALALPKERTTLTLQVQPINKVNADGRSYTFKPVLFYKMVKNLGAVRDSIDFPPNGEAGFQEQRTYEKGRDFLQVTQSIDAKEDDEAVVLSVYMQPQRRHREDQEPHDVMVLASTSSDQILAPDQEYLKTLVQGDLVHYLRLDTSLLKNSQQKYTAIRIQNCIGKINFKFLSDENDNKSRIRPSRQ